MNHAEQAASMDTQTLKERIQHFEQTYREGHPLISDEVFDHVYVAELYRREPDHPVFKRVGAEPDFGSGKVVHPAPMLSTEKAYTKSEVLAFLRRVESEASKLGIDHDGIEFRLTPKLDGMAARYDGEVLATRGDGLKGNDVTSALERGVTIDGQGVGEIVMTTAYFTANLCGTFKHPRNVVVGAVSAKDLNEDLQQALDDGAIHFRTYDKLGNIICGIEALMRQLDEFVERLQGECEYPTDGVIIEVTNERIKERLGATSHHHRWMVAKKSKGESAVTEVLDIEWTTGRTGRVTPTVLIEPVHLSGATLSRVTAHHAGNVRTLCIGKGASLRIIRSGEVIPFIDEMVKRAESVSIPTACPSCGTNLLWDGDFIVCTGVSCEAQLVRRLTHFFEILGNLDLFGQKSVQKIVDGGHTDLVSIYKLSASDFEACGFGPKQSANLVDELKRSRTDAVEDWRFLGAIGIPRLGRGSSRRLLKAHALETLCDVAVEEIQAVESFGPIVAPNVHRDLATMWPTIRGLLDLGFNLVGSDAPTEGPLVGKRVVFTGAMPKPRKEMEADAAALGAEVQKSVSGKTDWLVTGERVGATKIKKAEKMSVTVMPLAEYLAAIGATP